MKKATITIYFLLNGIFTQAQQALLNYQAAIQALDSQAESKAKSDERGKALAKFFDSRIAESNKEKAVQETLPYFRQLVDYDFLAAYKFLMRVNNQSDMTIFMNNHLSKNEQTLVRAVAKHTTLYANTMNGPAYPSNVPLPGKGVRGNWQNSAMGSASSGSVGANATVNGKEAVTMIEEENNKKTTPILTSFKGSNGKYGFRDPAGKEIVSPKYHRVKDFSDRIAAVCIMEDGTEKWGYMNESGKEITAFIYGDALPFSEGLAAARPLGKTWDAFYGFIDKKGQLVIPHLYPFIFDMNMYDGWRFKNGKAKVYKDGRFFYIDKTGKELMGL